MLMPRNVGRKRKKKWRTMVGVHGGSQLGELLFPCYQKYPHAPFTMFYVSEN